MTIINRMFKINMPHRAWAHSGPPNQKEQPSKIFPHIDMGPSAKCKQCEKRYCTCYERQNGTWANLWPIQLPSKLRKVTREQLQLNYNFIKSNLEVLIHPKYRTTALANMYEMNRESIIIKWSMQLLKIKKEFKRRRQSLQSK